MDSSRLARFINLTAELLNMPGNSPAIHGLVTQVTGEGRLALIPSDPTYRRAFFVVATRLSNLGYYHEALQISEHAYEGCRRLLGEEHEDTLLAKSNLASALNSAGHTTEAIEHCRDMIPLVEKNDKLPELLIGVAVNYGLCLNANGRYKESRDWLLGIRDRLERKFAPENEHMIHYYNCMATSMMLVDELLEAKSILTKCLEPATRKLGEDHPTVLTLLHNLAEVHRRLGDSIEACRLFEQVYQQRKNVLGPYHPETLSAQSLAAFLLGELGENQKAHELFSSALEGFRKTTRPENHGRLTCTHNYAEFLRRMGTYEEAKRLLEELVATRERVLGPEHPETITSLAALGVVEAFSGSRQSAADRIRRALEMSEKTLGVDHLQTAELRMNLAIMNALQEHWDDAFWTLTESLRILERKLAMQLGELLPETADLVLSLNYYIDLLLTILLGSRLQDEEKYICQAHVAASQRKGMWLDCDKRRLTSLMSSRNPEIVRLFQQELQLTQLRALVMQLLLPLSKKKVEHNYVEMSEFAQFVGVSDVVETPPDLQRLLISIDTERQQIANRLSAETGYNSDSLPSPPADFAEHLSPVCALLDFVLYSKVDLEQSIHCGFKGSDFYVVFVLIRGKYVAAVELGSADRINEAIQEARQCIIQRDAEGFGGQARVLMKLILQPIWDYLPSGIQKLYVHADGDLCLLPLECLFTPDDEERFLVEDKSISYLSASSDLIKKPQRIPNCRYKALVVSAPNFGPLCTEKSSLLQNQYFPPLPGTEEEGERVEKLLERQGYHTSHLCGQQATRENVMESLGEGLSIIHIATHGVFDDNSARGMILMFPESSGRRKQIYLPSPTESLSYSYLALTDVNRYPRILDKVSVGNSVRNFLQGRLCASDIMHIDLAATELLVLSACHTAEGQVLKGQGVFGFRRAAALAGVQSLLMSLWPLADKETVQFIENFYSFFFESEKRSGSEALRKTQLQFIKEKRAGGEWPDPFLWAPFICQESVYRHVRD